MTKKQMKVWYRRTYGRRRGKWQEFFVAMGYYKPLWVWEWRIFDV